MKKHKQVLTKHRTVKDLFPSRYWHYRSLLESKAAYEKIKKGLFFIGHPRSGHSILGALLDAHPDIALSHELDALAFLNAKFSKRQLVQMIINRSKQFAKAGNQWMGYSYKVPGGYQGRINQLKLVGDKRGGTTTKWFRQSPELFDKLKAMFPDTLFIYMYRNPFDSITTSFFRSQKRRGGNFDKADLFRKTDHFFDHAKLIHQFEEQALFDFRSIRAEFFLDNPEEVLKSLLNRFAVEAPEDYLKNCTSILFQKPPKRRSELGLWDSRTIDYVFQRMEETPYFWGYTFED
ncbi:sulfotransferase family protein [Phaeodactylibacter xiamenensis]|uniref:sulfotransferase family protein n=1 Tax=Phaeodactylibacter xiamenensis TaxID=1524460 RepID=UPI0024A82293|nr:sulfotransferase [Phaeodactylibacter xiamenensis]